MLAIQKKISPYNYNSTNNIKYLVIHDVGANGTAKNNADYFYGGNRGASAHYFVDDESIWQVVEDYHGAWHCGDNNGYGRFAFGITNSNSLSIEMCLPSGDITETTVINTIELAAYLIKKYNIPLNNVVRHYDASRKNCPAKFSANNWARWWSFKNRLESVVTGNDVIDNVVTVIPAPITDYSKYANYVGSRCKELQEKLIFLGYNCGGYGADGKFGKGTYNSLIQFQKDNGLVVDGLAGTNTFAKLDELINKKAVGSNSFNFEQWVRDLQSECNRQGFSNQKVDGIPGANTLEGCPTLRLSASGKITRLLQARLVSLGYNISIDGCFGENTKSAVINYQKSKGLSADGIVGQNTWRKLLNL